MVKISTYYKPSMEYFCVITSIFFYLQQNTKNEIKSLEIGWRAFLSGQYFMLNFKYRIASSSNFQIWTWNVQFGWRAKSDHAMPPVICTGQRLQWSRLIVLFYFASQRQKNTTFFCNVIFINIKVSNLSEMSSRKYLIKNKNNVPNNKRRVNSF